MTTKTVRSPRPESTVFTKYWNIFVKEVVARDDFTKGHLKLLELLCCNFVDYDALTAVLQAEGWTYEGGGRNGNQIKPRPEFAMRAKCLAEIRSYANMLGISLKKPLENNEPPEDDWEMVDKNKAMRAKKGIPELEEDDDEEKFSKETL